MVPAPWRATSLYAGCVARWHMALWQESLQVGIDHMVRQRKPEGLRASAALFITTHLKGSNSGPL